MSSESKPSPSPTVKVERGASATVVEKKQQQWETFFINSSADQNGESFVRIDGPYLQQLLRETERGNRKGAGNGKSNDKSNGKSDGKSAADAKRETPTSPTAQISWKSRLDAMARVDRQLSFPKFPEAVRVGKRTSGSTTGGPTTYTAQCNATFRGQLLNGMCEAPTIAAAQDDAARQVYEQYVRLSHGPEQQLSTTSSSSASVSQSLSSQSSVAAPVELNRRGALESRVLLSKGRMQHPEIEEVRTGPDHDPTWKATVKCNCRFGEIIMQVKGVGSARKKTDAVNEACDSLLKRYDSMCLEQEESKR